MLFKKISIISILISFLSLQEIPFNIKRISDKDFRYEFYTLKKEITPKLNKDYVWFKGGTIHTAQSGIAGELLQGEYKKFYHSNQLAEQGTFKKGLRVGTWKTWYENGKLATVSKWSKGLKRGKSIYYNTEGNVIEIGTFKKNVKNGIWINYEKKDTLKYKNGEVVITQEKKSKREKNNKDTDVSKKVSFFKRLFSKFAKTKSNERKSP
ncbi:hypothetical protein BWK58_00135 [Flavobacterium columnare]|nr:hypothetical protein BWK58_00135 [Flavobacterium columnare]